MKRHTKTIITFLFFLFELLSVSVAQGKIIPPLSVNEYPNINESGGLFYRDHIGEDDRTGNDLVFDPSGKAFIYQWEHDQVYELDSKYQISRIIILPQRDSREVCRLVKADGSGFLFFNFYGIESYYDYHGNPIFHTDIYDLMQEPVTSINYLSNILFFVDRKGRIYSVLNPSMDQINNHRNYQDPEQTIKMFENGSGIDLQGLTRDSKGLLHLNGHPIYLTVKNVGQYRYQFLQNNVYINSEEKSEVTLNLDTNQGDILESVALHPSGNIYFLNYNKLYNKHILYMIENTWDIASKIAWDKQQR